jgi:hypothetical protein
MRYDAQEMIGQNKFRSFTINAEFAFGMSQNVTKINVEDLQMEKCNKSTKFENLPARHRPSLNCLGDDL